MTVGIVTLEPAAASPTVLVTGGHPLLGPALVARLLGDGHRVLVPVPPLLPGLTVLRSWPRSGTFGGPTPDVVEHDPEDPDVPAALRTGVGLVLHLGAGPVGDDLAGRSTAVLDALFALGVAELNGARLVAVSIDGDGSHTGTLEGLVAGYRSAHDVDTVLARVTDCYGPGSDGPAVGVVSRLLAAAAAGTVVVDARDQRHHTPCFVDDAVDAVLHLAGADPVRPGPVHVGPSAGLTTTELAQQVCRATGADVRVVGLAPLEGPGRNAGLRLVDTPDGRVDLDLGHDAGAAGWRPRVTLAEGLRRCLAATATRSDETATGPTGVAAGMA